MKLLLASASPRRADLLRAAGFDFETTTVHVDESPRPGEPPADYVRRLAAEKSLAAQARDRRGCPVLAADTTVVVDRQLLGKPRDEEEAAEMLRRLAGRRHDVLTGVSLRRGAVELGGVERTIVEFRPLRPDEVRWYVASGEWQDKAGGYAIQGLASRFVIRVDGSYSNVVGLPIALVDELVHALASAG